MVQTTQSSKPQTALELCRRMAGEIWRGERVHAFEPVGGLNNETAVRLRLRNILAPLKMHPEGLSAEACQYLTSVNILRDRPPVVLEKSEAMLMAQSPGKLLNPELFASADHSVIGALSRVIICQSIAARMGLWPVRPAALTDAKTAHAVFRLANDIENGDLESLRRRGNESYRQKRYQESAAYFLSADRIRRSVEGLFKVAVALGRSGNEQGALWAIRACLLEDLSQFPSAKWLLKVQIVESNLGTKLSREPAMTADSEGLRPDLSRGAVEFNAGIQECDGRLDDGMDEGENVPTVTVDHPGAGAE